MFKKSLMLAALACAMAPIVAHSWTLTTRVNTVGGTLQVETPWNGNAGGYIQSAVGVKMRNYSTVNHPVTVPITFTAYSGWRIARVVKDGLIVARPASPYTGATVTVPANNTAPHSVGVSFIKKLVPVSVTATLGGWVTTPGLRNLQETKKKSYVFTPYKGRSLVAIIVNGVTYGSSQTIPDIAVSTDNWAVEEPVVITITVPDRTSLTDPSYVGKLVVKGVFKGVVAKASAPQIVRPGDTVSFNAYSSLNNRADGTLQFRWTQIGGPATVALTNASTAEASFTAYTSQNKLGRYVFKVAVSNSLYPADTDNAYTTVNVARSIADAIRNTCGSCHYQPISIFGNWSSSVHKDNYVGCASCHVGSDTGAHPGDDPLKSCVNCHTDSTVIQRFQLHSTSRIP